MIAGSVLRGSHQVLYRPRSDAETITGTIRIVFPVRALPTTISWNIVSAPTVADDDAQWAGPYCEDAFEQMSEDKLFNLVRNDVLSPGDLTFAAEIAGRRLPADMIVPVLSRLLSAYSPLVREGAARGLAKHLTPDVRKALQEALVDEKSWGVSETIEEILADG